MLSCEFKQDEVLEVDLHHMKVWEAWMHLDKCVSTASSKVKEVIVIHGYHNGTTLLNMVRNDFDNKRVTKKFLSLNKGVTSLILS